MNCRELNRIVILVLTALICIVFVFSADMVLQMNEGKGAAEVLTGGKCTTAEAVYADCMDPDADVPAEEAACQSETGDLITLDMIPENPDLKDNEKKSIRLQGVDLPRTEKSIPMAVIVIGFGGNDAEKVPYSTGNWAWPIFTGDYYDGKSVRAYFRDQSYGKFTFDPVEETSEYGVGGNTNPYDMVNDGIIHVSIDNVHQDWSTSDGAARRKAKGEAFAEAVREASKYVDFARYDSNGNGNLDRNEFATVFIAAGFDSGISEQYKKQNDNKYMRSHKATIEGTGAEVPSVSGPSATGIVKTVTINDYVAVSEFIERDADGKEITLLERRSSLAHELGHHLGLPDLYAESGSGPEYLRWQNYEVSYTSLMGKGSWGADVPNANGVRDYIPYSLDPWSKIQLGWIIPQTMTGTGINVVTGQDYDTLVPNSIVKIPVNYDEYYLIEARVLSKWDAGMDFIYDNMLTKDNAGGMIIWHIDEQVLDELDYSLGERAIKINNTNHRPAVMPLFVEKENDKYTMTSSGQGDVYTRQPFFDKTKWKRYQKAIGFDIPLTTYNGRPIESKPDTRGTSGAGIDILDDAQRVMAFRYISRGHVHKCVYVPAKDPKCERNGNIAYYECEECGKLFEDPDCTKEYSEDDIKRPALGHDWQMEYISREPTADTDGEQWEVCSRCGEGRWASIPATGKREDQMGKDGTPIGKGASIEAADQFLSGYSLEEDPSGAVFKMLRLQSAKQTDTSVTLKWVKPGAAKKVVIYGSKCGEYETLEKLKEVRGLKSIKITTVSGKKLKKGTYYKFIAVALDGKDNVVSTSRQIHVATSGVKKKSNNTDVFVSKTVLNKAAALKKGKTLSIKAVLKTASGCKVEKHVGLRYQSTDTSVASVSVNGIIKARSKGSCTVYAYAQNGIYKTVKVTVK